MASRDSSMGRGASNADLPQGAGSKKRRAPKSAKAGQNKKARTEEESPTRAVTRYQDPKYKYQYFPARDLPPMTSTDDIFDDIAEKAINLGLDLVLEHLRGRKIRVATMCSGTDAPIIALRMVKRALSKRSDNSLNYEHLFSCEIEPMKAAFLARNFHLGLLIFRDVRAIAQAKYGTKPTTAWGGVADVPGNVDLLVAGFSCVDFSSLNANPKDLDEVGESSGTFKAIMTYCLIHRPKIVILENVQGAPWQKILKYMDDQNMRYSAASTKVDTKMFYYPQTRNRRYFIMVDQDAAGGKENADNMVEQWASLVKSFERKASSPVEEFLLPRDDPRVHNGQIALKAVGKSQEPAWHLSRGRHHNVRSTLQLGQRRPVTEWMEGEQCKVLDFGSKPWNRAQVDRILDNIEINFLRNVVSRGFDCYHKYRYWDLSQNVDRNNDTIPWGVVGCITPRGIAYATMRAGPLIGVECLSLQGLDPAEITTTRETEQELINLAGNAMSTTVVGAAMLSALICAGSVIDQGRETDTEETAVTRFIDMDDTRLSEATPLDLVDFNQQATYDAIKLARVSTRLCYCEGPDYVSSRAINTCTKCGHTTCQRCSGIPKHAYGQPDKNIVANRVHPSIVRDQIRAALPMRLWIGDFDLAKIESEASHTKGAKTPAGRRRFELFFAAIKDSFGEELRYQAETRTHEWAMIWKGTSSRLELRVGQSSILWYLFVEPSKDAHCDINTRDLLQHPVARMEACDPTKPFNGDWAFCLLPDQRPFKICISGVGQLTRSWESRIGLQLPQFKDKHVWDKLLVEVLVDRTDNDSAPQLDNDISGTYELLPNCGTSFGSLHKQIIPADSTETPIYLFHDPTHFGDPKEDSFVFAPTFHRTNYGECRQIVAKVDASWLPSDRLTSQVECTAQGRWIRSKARLRTRPDHDYEKPYISVTPGSLDIDIHKRISDQARGGQAGHVCSDDTIAVLSCKIPLLQHEFRDWDEGQWATVTANKEGSTVTLFRWLLEKVRGLNQFPDNWRKLLLPRDIVRCSECAPRPPNVKWRRAVRHQRTSIKPYEAPEQAVIYERIMKGRPTPFLMQIRAETADMVHSGCLRIGLNIPTLAHRTLARFMDRLSDSTMRVWWRLSTDYKCPTKPALPNFTLRNNTGDPMRAHTFIDGSRLRPEQCRSFHWMVKQEDEPPTFTECEIGEATIRELGWRATVMVRRQCGRRGGALTDDVGYGKTVLILALIAEKKPQDELHAKSPYECHKHLVDYPQHDSPDGYTPSLEHEEHVSLQCDGHIPLKATLIVTPPHLLKQWYQQIRQFLGSKYNVLIIESIQHLRQATIQDYKNADIVLVAWSVLREKDDPKDKEDEYADRLSLFGVVPQGPQSGGRAYDKWLQHCYTVAMYKVRMLQESSDLAIYATDLELERCATESSQRATRKAASKRLRGEAYKKSARKGKDPGETAEALDADEAEPGRKWKARKCKLADFGFFKKDCSIDEVHGVPLNLFCWARGVIDEYPHAGEKVTSIFASLQTTSRWILSATPALNVFGDVKQLAKLLGVHLGIDDLSSSSMSPKDVKRYRDELSPGELFQTFVEDSTPMWHEERHRQAQRFMDYYARQNDTVLPPGLRRAYALVTVDMAPIERTIFMELQQQLHSQDMKVVKTKAIRADVDRGDRMDALLQGCKNGTEALINAATRFIHDFKEHDTFNTRTVHARMINKRGKESRGLLVHIGNLFGLAEWLLEQIELPDKDKHYTELKRYLHDGSFGDEDAMHSLRGYLHTAERDAWSYDPSEHSYDAQTKKALPVTSKGCKLALRELAANLRTLIAEYVARRRALRYLKTTRLVQASSGGQLGLCNGSCGKFLPMDDLAVLGMCGHLACENCLNQPERNGECVKSWCLASAAPHHVHPCRDLEKDTHGMTWLGSKIDAIIDLVRHRTVKDRQVLLFVQNDEIGFVLQDAFNRRGVTFESMLEKTRNPQNKNGLASVKTEVLNATLERFQKTKRYLDVRQEGEKQEDWDQRKTPNPNWRKCLILNMFSEKAAGTNLPNANHVIFVAPPHTNSQDRYQSIIKQSIGRALRHLQTRDVWIYMFATKRSIDVDILQMRTSSRLLQMGDRYVLKHEDNLTDDEKKQQWGTGYEKVADDADELW